MIFRRDFLKASAATGALATMFFVRSGVAEGNIGAENADLDQGVDAAPPKPWLESVSVGDFGAIGDADPANAERNSKAIQEALNTNNSVYLGGESEVYAIATSLKMHPGQRIYGNGATLIASRRMSQILSAADDVAIEGILFDSNNRPPRNGVPIQATGAVYGINIRDISGCRVRKCVFTRYKRGVSVTSSGPGMKCTNHLFEDCRAIAGFVWPDWRSGNEQLGAYVGSEARPVTRAISNYSEFARDAEDVHDIRFLNWSAHEGQYGLALHRCSKVKVKGGKFREMSRAISIQHQSRDISIIGVLVENSDSAGIHIAQGAHQILIEDNSIFGTMANDNAGIQGYYGVRNIIVRNNILDSQFDKWKIGIGGESRRPGAAIRFGQQVENVTISGNKMRGFRWGILLKTTIYDEVIHSSDPNYFASGIRNFIIENNKIFGDYYFTQAGSQKSHIKKDTFGVLVAISAPWENKRKGGWDIANIKIRQNWSDNLGKSFACFRSDTWAWVYSPNFLENSVYLCGNVSTNSQADLSASGLEYAIESNCTN